MEQWSHTLSRSSAGNDTALDNGVFSEHHTTSDKRIMVAWIALQLAGQVTLPILVVTLLFSKRIAPRNPTVINLCIVWAIGTIPPLLLYVI
jgi:hypothetical protein